VKTRSLHRAARAKVPYPVVALVGYTNAGKSTLFNRLTGAEVMAKDMLFATLDPTMRAVKLPDGTEVILSDTVGFISDLPTQLVAAFRATLEEVLDADLICHVRDISHPQTEEQAEDVRRILEDLGVAETMPQIEVWNKIDLLPRPERETRVTEAARRENVHAISAITGEGLAPFLSAVAGQVSEPRTSHDADAAPFGRAAARLAVRARGRGGGGKRRRGDPPHRALDRPGGAGVSRAWRRRGLRPPFITTSPNASSAKPAKRVRAPAVRPAPARPARSRRAGSGA
jgi:GTP-binding protein HflX